MALGDTKNVLAGIPDVAGGFWVKDLIKSPESYPKKDTNLKDDGWTPVGFISEDGVTEANERDTEKVKAWGGDTIRVLQNEHTQTFTFSFYELGNPEVLKLIYGDDNVTVGDDGAVEITQNSKVLPHKSFCIEVLDGDKKIRKFIPDGQITETGELQMTHSAVMGIEATVEAFADSKGNKVYTTQSKATPAKKEEEEEEDTGRAAELTIDTSDITGWKAGQPVNTTITATGGDKSYTFSSDDLPAGLNIASNGEISGETSVTGSQSFTVKVADGSGKSATKRFTVDIAESM